jgi:hypothetical protein
VYLLLDSAQKKAAGFAGCNRFFSSYKLKWHSLTFGPQGATRMACQEEESALEARFLEVLTRAQGWRIDSDDLLLQEGGNILARLAKQPEGDSDSGLQSLTLHSRVLNSGPVTLVHGVYRAQAAPGSASLVEVRLTDKRLFGSLDGAQVGAVIVTASLGGLARSVSVVVVQNSGRLGEHGYHTAG